MTVNKFFSTHDEFTSLIRTRFFSEIKEKKTYEDFSDFNQIPNFVTIQRASFQDFLKNGLIRGFNKTNPMVFLSANQRLEIYFFPQWIQFRKPEFTIRNCIRLGKTYGSAIYLPVVIKSNSFKKSELAWLCLGFLPLMTVHGHFLINGIPRVVLHQMIRNPGIYTILKDVSTKLPTIRIVPEQGSWIHLSIDKKNRIWVTTRILRRKVSILVFLQALGISLFEIFHRIPHSQILEKSFVKKLKPEAKTRSRHDNILVRANLDDHPTTQEEAWRYLYAHFQEYRLQTREQPITKENAKEFFWKIIWNPKIRYLGQLGRQQFCEKLGSIISKTEYLLVEDDMVLATEALIQLLFGDRFSDDIDSLTNKRIRGCGDFLQDELARGLQEFEIIANRKFVNTPPAEIQTFWKFHRSLLSKSVSKSWKSFFTSGTLAQFMDETNPLAETTHKRRVTVLGPGGVNRKQTTIQIRGIHPSYYGRLCPIETPEGQNAGLVNSFTLYTTKDSFGYLKTPFYRVYKGQVQTNLPFVSSIPQKELEEIIAPPDFYLSKLKMLPNIRIPIRKNWKFDYGLSTQITSQSTGILQMISIATSLIPFLEHDDANRALMGSNMQRQAVPLVKPEAAFVQTGLESRVISDVNHSVQAIESGYITSVTANDISIYKPTEKRLAKEFSNFQSTRHSFFQTKKFLQNRTIKNNRFSNSFFCLHKPQTPKKFHQVKWLNSEQFNISFDFFNSSPLKTNFDYFKTLFLLRKIRYVLPSEKKTNIGSNFFLSSFKKKVDLDFFNSLKSRKEQKRHSFEFTSANDFTVLNRTQRQKNSNEFEISGLQKNIFLNGFINSYDKASPNLSNYSLDVYEKTNQSTCIFQSALIKETSWVEKGDILADGSASFGGKLALGKNVLVAYLPWEGYNFEDAILISEKLVLKDIFTSLHLDYYEVEVKNTQYGLETITNKIPLEVHDPAKDNLRIQRLNSQGLIEIGSWVEEGDYLVGKVSPSSPKGPSVQQQYEKLYNVIMQRENTNLKNTSLRVPKSVEGFVLDVQILPPREADVAALAGKNAILRVRVVLLQKRKIQVGDKMAGRHGNKGVISKILSVQDMPYLPDGTPIDIVLNPLGVPSRMNVGQLLESLLGLAGFYLQESYSIQLFDEKFGSEASRSFVYSKLYQASVKTGNFWLFEPQHPGKVRLFDGRTGELFDQAITVGSAYMLKLVHLVDDKIHARSIGPYSAITQQPVRGRSRNGGQRLGEMEVWALQAYGAAFTLQELLTIKSDDVDGRKQAVFRIYTNKTLKFGQPESLKVLLRELQALCFNLKIYSINRKTKKIESINLKELENF